MAQYIPKSAVVAEIEKLKEKYALCPTRNNYEDGLKEGRLIGYKDALNKINTLKVKEVELSLIEPHIKDEWNKINTGHTYSIIDSYNIFVGICTYFYELGLNVQKGK